MDAKLAKLYKLAEQMAHEMMMRRLTEKPCPYCKRVIEAEEQHDHE